MTEAILTICHLTRKVLPPKETEDIIKNTQKESVRREQMSYRMKEGAQNTVTLASSPTKHEDKRNSTKANVNTLRGELGCK